MTAKKFPEQPSKTNQMLTMIALAALSDLAVRAARYVTCKLMDRATVGYQRYWLGLGKKDPAELMILDASHALISGVATRGKWIEAYNQIGIVMPSMADYYRASRCCSPDTILQIREDLENHIVHTSTVHTYSPDTLEASITQYHGLTRQKDAIAPVEAPFLHAKSLLDVMAEPSGLRYVQCIFGTDDSRDTIATRLSDLAGVPPENITLTTPPFDEMGVTAPRIHSPIRGMAMSYARDGPRKYLYLLADIEAEAGVAHVLTARR